MKPKRKRKQRKQAAAVCELSHPEKIVLQSLTLAASQDEPCPTNLDIEMMVGASSSSYGPGVIEKLEKKGLIKVLRFQRFRRVQICSSGQWTARSKSQHTERAHVPRGAGSMSGRLAKKARMMR